MLVWTVEFAGLLILVRPYVLHCWLSLLLILVLQLVGRKLTDIMMVAIRNLHV